MHKHPDEQIDLYTNKRTPVILFPWDPTTFIIKKFKVITILPIAIWLRMGCRYTDENVETVYFHNFCDFCDFCDFRLSDKQSFRGQPLHIFHKTQDMMIISVLEDVDNGN